MKSMRFFYVFMLCLSVFVSAQKKEVQITGLIQHMEQNEDLNGYYIENLRTGVTKITDLFGRFQMNVAKNDTLYCSGFNVVDRIFVVDDYHLEKKYFIILLEQETYALDGLVIQGTPLTGYLEYDIKRFKFSDTIATIEKTLGAPKYKSDGFQNDYPAYTFASPLSFNLDAFYDIVSGKRRKRQLLISYQNKTDAQQKIIQYVGSDFLVNELQIPQEEHEKFLEYVWNRSNIEIYYKQKNYFKIFESLHSHRIPFLLYLDLEKSQQKKQEKETLPTSTGTTSAETSTPKTTEASSSGTASTP